MPSVVFLAHEICAHLLDGYRRWPAIDIPLHFFGGFAILYFAAGALRIWEERGFIRPPEAWVQVVMLFGLVNTAAVFWELAEFTADMTIGSHCQLSLEDTLLDLFMGMLGGLAYLLPRIPAAFRSFIQPLSST